MEGQKISASLRNIFSVLENAVIHVQMRKIQIKLVQKHFTFFYIFPTSYQDGTCPNYNINTISVTISRDTVTTSWSADDICFIILNIIKQMSSADHKVVTVSRNIVTVSSRQLIRVGKDIN